MSLCESLIDFPNGILMLVAAPVVEEGAVAPAADAPANGKP